MGGRRHEWREKEEGGRWGGGELHGGGVQVVKEGEGKEAENCEVAVWVPAGREERRQGGGESDWP